MYIGSVGRMPGVAGVSSWTCSHVVPPSFEYMITYCSCASFSANVPVVEYGSPSQRVQATPIWTAIVAGSFSSVMSVGDWISTRGCCWMRSVFVVLPASKDECTSDTSAYFAMNVVPLSTALLMPLTTMYAALVLPASDSLIRPEPVPDACV